MHGFGIQLILHKRDINVELFEKILDTSFIILFELITVYGKPRKKYKILLRQSKTWLL